MRAGNQTKIKITNDVSLLNSGISGNEIAKQLIYGNVQRWVSEYQKSDSSILQNKNNCLRGLEKTIRRAGSLVKRSMTITSSPIAKGIQDKY